MFSVGKIGGSAAGVAKYYTTGDYYTKGKEEPGLWGGQGAERLGLAGMAVEQKALAEKLGGKLGPLHRSSWNQDRPDAKRNKGFDFTFSAPKSVSIMALVGGDGRLVEAVRTANAEAMTYAERYAAVRERGTDGSITTRQTGNLTYASFPEKASRALDPHLHVHNPVLNATFDAARGRWYAVDASHLLTLQKTMNRVATAALARRVQELGYRIDADRGEGSFEIAGILRETITAFSTRQAEIDEVAESKGYKTAAERAAAWAQTRGAKETLKDGEFETVLRENMFAMAEQGHIQQSPLDLDRLRDQARAFGFSPSVRDARDAALYGLESALFSEAVVEERQVLEAALTGGVGRVTLPEVQAALKQLEDRGQVLRPERASGDRAHIWAMTTRALLRREIDYASEVRRGRNTVLPIHRPGRADQRLDRFRIETREGPVPLSDEQKAAARIVLTTSDRFTVIQGVAGAGKSEMVGAIMQAAPRRQHLGIAPTGKALMELAGKTGIETATVQAVIARGGRGIESGAIVYADEASMNDTAQALSLARIARKRGFRLVTIGDKAQLPAIGAGRPHADSLGFAGSVAVLETSRRHRAGSQAERVMTVIRAGQAWQEAAMIPAAARQKPPGPSPWRALKPALGAALREVEGPGPGRRIADVRAEVVGNAAREWIRDRDPQKGAILAPQNRTRTLLNAAIRAALFERGELDAEKAVAAVTLTPKAMDPAQKRNAYSYRKGDVVIFHRAADRYGIGRGDRFAVIKRGDNDTLTLRAIDRKERDRIVSLKRPIEGIAAYEAQQQTVAPGDRIVIVAQMGDVRNGEQGRVDRIAGRMMHVTFEDGRKRQLDLDRNQLWSHGYAVTMHKAQGATMDVARMVLLGRDRHMLHANAANNLFSRARETVEVHTDSFATVRNQFARRTGQKTSAIEAMIGDRRGTTRSEPQNRPEPGGRTARDVEAILGAMVRHGRVAATPAEQALYRQAEILRRGLAETASAEVGSLVKAGRALAERIREVTGADGRTPFGGIYELTDEQKEQREAEAERLALQDGRQIAARGEARAAAATSEKEAGARGGRDRGGELEM